MSTNTDADLQPVRPSKSSATKVVNVHVTHEWADWLGYVSDAVCMPRAEVIGAAMRLFAESRGLKAPPNRNPSRSW